MVVQVDVEIGVESEYNKGAHFRGIFFSLEGDGESVNWKLACGVEFTFEELVGSFLVSLALVVGCFCRKIAMGGKKGSVDSVLVLFSSLFVGGSRSSPFEWDYVG